MVRAVLWPCYISVSFPLYKLRCSDFKAFVSGIFLVNFVSLLRMAAHTICEYNSYTVEQVPPFVSFKFQNEPKCRNVLLGWLKQICIPDRAKTIYISVSKWVPVKVVLRLCIRVHILECFVTAISSFVHESGSFFKFCKRRVTLKLYQNRYWHQSQGIAWRTKKKKKKLVLSFLFCKGVYRWL